MTKGRKKKGAHQQRGGFSIGDFGKGFAKGFEMPFKFVETSGINDIIATTPLAPAAAINRGILSGTQVINRQLGQGRKK